MIFSLSNKYYAREVFCLQDSKFMKKCTFICLYEIFFVPLHVEDIGRCIFFAMKTTRLIVLAIASGLLWLPVRTAAQEKAPGEAVAQSETAVVQPDRPGFGTGTTVLDRGVIQWELGFDVEHYLGTHLITLPTTSLRFGVDRRAELRLDYGGVLAVSDHPDTDPSTSDEHLYAPSPIYVGSKIMLWEGSEERRLKWIPKVSVMAEIGLPVTKEIAKRMPISGNIDLLFENEVTDWFSIGYDVGAHWVEWAPMPDIFASLGLNFSPIDKLGLYIENFNIFDCDADEILVGYSNVYMVYLNFGVTYLVHPRVQLDLYAGFNCFHSETMLSGPKNDSFLGFGVAWLIRD